MQQTKKQSWLEAITNTLIGFVISLLATFFILPLWGVESTAGQNLGITIFYTGISVLRSYVIRRFFNKKSINNIQVTDHQIVR